MELTDENLTIDLIENQKLSYKRANSVLKERYPGSERSISSAMSTEKVTETVMDASSKVISAF